MTEVPGRGDGRETGKASALRSLIGIHAHIVSPAGRSMTAVHAGLHPGPKRARDDRRLASRSSASLYSRS
jgi:hypothetical protein